MESEGFRFIRKLVEYQFEETRIFYRRFLYVYVLCMLLFVF